MIRKSITLGAAIFVSVAYASDVDAIEPAPSSEPTVWWDPLGLFQGPTAPLVRRKFEGSSSEYQPAGPGPGYRTSYVEEGGPGIPVDYSYDHLIDQP